MLSAAFRSPFYVAFRVALYAVLFYCLLRAAHASYERDRAWFCARVANVPIAELTATRWCALLWDVTLGKYGKIEICYPGYVYPERDCVISKG